MQSKAATVDQYLANLPAERRGAVEAVRDAILDNLPDGYEEGMQYGMIGYFVPHSVYPDGYHCDPRQPLPFAGLAAQKNHFAIYLMCIYGDAKHEAWFRAAWSKTGKKLDMGKSCVRFKKLDDVPLEVVGEAIRRVPVAKYLAHYEETMKTAGAKRSAKKKTVKKKAAAKKRATAKKKKTVKKKATKKKATKKKYTAKKNTAIKKATKKNTAKKKTAKKKAAKKVKKRVAQRTAKARTQKKSGR